MHSSRIRTDCGSGHLIGECLWGGGTPLGRHPMADTHRQIPPLADTPGRHPLYTTPPYGQNDRRP